MEAPSRLKFQKLTWLDGSMAETIQVAFDGWVYEDCSSTSFKRFLQTHAINAECMRLIMAHATNTKLKLKADQQPDIMSPDKRQRVINVYGENPECYKVPETPLLQRIDGFDLKDFPSGIGHQLFLGVMEIICLNLLRRYVAAAGNKDSFETELNRKLFN